MSTSTVTSEALQLKLRQLLPSQQGFGTDLSASDTIIPIIDLTRAAEGSDVGENLQTAVAFGSQTSFESNNSTVVIANTAGFFKFQAGVTLVGTTGTDQEAQITMTDGATIKILWEIRAPALVATRNTENIEFTVFLRAGDSISATTNESRCFITGSVRQIADVNGTLVQPVGFTPQ